MARPEARMEYNNLCGNIVGKILGKKRGGGATPRFDGAKPRHHTETERDHRDVREWFSAVVRLLSGERLCLLVRADNRAWRGGLLRSAPRRSCRSPWSQGGKYPRRPARSGSFVWSRSVHCRVS